MTRSKRLSLTSLLSAFAAGAAAAAPCTPSDIVADGRATAVASRVPAEAGITLQAPGLGTVDRLEASWTRCADAFRTGLYGRSLVTVSGAAIDLRGGEFFVFEPKVVPPGREPAHPTVAGAAFNGSSSLAIGEHRVGAWRYRDGRTLVARYRPGDASPVPLLTSRLPLQGLSYLGAPDAVGGTLTLWQRVSGRRYRRLLIGWGEAGLRAPGAHGGSARP